MGESYRARTFADSVGSSPATAQGGVHAGRARRRRRRSRHARRPSTGSTTPPSAALDLSGTTQLTVEFWLNWTTFANDDRHRDGVHPQLPQQRRRLPGRPQRAASSAASSRVGIGRGEARATPPTSPGRPPAPGTTTPSSSTPAAPAAQQIIPYVDGQPVSYEKLDSGTGAGNFANSTLYFMSRGAGSLFGKGDLDEVAIYNRALSAATIAEHYQATAPTTVPVASLRSAQLGRDNPADGHLRRLGLERPRRLDRQIRMGPRRQRQLRDQHGPDADSDQHLRHRRHSQVGLRVTDNGGAVRDRDHDDHVVAEPRSERVLHRHAQPGCDRRPGQLRRLRLHRPRRHDRQIRMGPRRQRHLRDQHRHDADDEPAAYPTPAKYNVSLRVTDNGGGTVDHDPHASPSARATTATRDRARHRRAARLLAHGRRDRAEPRRRAGPSPATTVKAAPPSASPAASRSDPNTAAALRRRQRRRERRRRPLRQASQLTLEFWLKWNAYANDDDLAFEFTPNFNDNAGGFLVDPNAASSAASSASASAAANRATTRYFARPSAGVWHHYAFVFDTDGAGGAADHPLRRRHSRSPTKSSTAAPAPATSPTRRSTSCRATPRPCSAKAASTRSRSTAGP